jgi:hypothetical protein
MVESKFHFEIVAVVDSSICPLWMITDSYLSFVFPERNKSVRLANGHHLGSPSEETFGVLDGRPWLYDRPGRASFW